MKNTFAYILLLGIGIAIILGYYHLFPREKIAYDDDQEGLSNQIFFKFSHVVAENTPKGRAADKFAELVNEKSNGTIKIIVFPNGSLFSDIEEITALKEGEVHFIAPATSQLGRLSPEWGVLDLPYAFPNHEAIQAGIHGPIGDHLLKSLQKNGLSGLAHWSNGFKQITSNKGQIRMPQDLRGQKIRVMNSDVIRSQFELVGAEAQSESFNSTYRLIEAGQMDGEENTISNIYSKKFYEVQKHLTISNHGYLGYVVMMDQKFWDQQSKNTQQILLEAMKETTAWNDQQAIKINEEQLELIKQNSSIQIHELSDNEKQEWKSKLDPVYDTLSSTIGEKLVEELKELSTTYKSQ